MKPTLIYHRGRHGRISDSLVLEENTIQAFEQAICESAEVIECDVWEELKVCHDPDGGNRKQEVPKFHDVLEAVDGRCALNVEIKSPSSAPAAMDLIRACIKSGRWSPEQFIVSAFHHRTALMCKEVLPEIKVGSICDGVLLSSYISFLKESGIDNLQLGWANIYMDMDAGYEMRTLIRDLGMELWVWTVNDRTVFESLSEYGVDAVFTDRPDLLR